MVPESRRGALSMRINNVTIKKKYRGSLTHDTVLSLRIVDSVIAKCMPLSFMMLQLLLPCTVTF